MPRLAIGAVPRPCPGSARASAGRAFVVAAAIAAVVVLTLVNASGVRAAGGLCAGHRGDQAPPAAGGDRRSWASHGVRGAFQPLPPVPLNVANVATATALTLFALTGFENATTPVGKVRNPSRTMPLALLGGTAFVALLYLLSLHQHPVAAPGQRRRRLARSFCRRHRGRIGAVRPRPSPHWRSRSARSAASTA